MKHEKRKNSHLIVSSEDIKNNKTLFFYTINLDSRMHLT